MIPPNPPSGAAHFLGLSGETAMTLRMTIVVCVVALVASPAAGQPPPPQFINVPGRVWEIRYDANDANHPGGRLVDRAVRVEIKEGMGGSYTARVRRFKMQGTSYKLKEDDEGGSFDITFAAHGAIGGRKRVSFSCGPIDYKTTPPLREVIIKGIWHPGQNPDPGARDDDRLQLVIVDREKMRKEVLEPCDEEPDSDVLEDTAIPPGDNVDNPPASP
jgi:hypothetical protein